MRKKILSIYLAVAIGFLSVVASAVPAYASNSTDWEDYFEITYTSTNIDSPYSLDFKDSNAQTAYKNLSEDERKKVDWDAFSAISAKDQNYKYGSLVFNNTTIPNLIKGIASSAGMVMSGAPDDTGFTADLQDKLTKISNAISSSNRKFGGKGISRKASSTHPNNFGLGTITLSKDFINDLRSSVAKFDNYTVYPQISADITYYTKLFGFRDLSANKITEWNEKLSYGRFVVDRCSIDDGFFFFNEGYSVSNTEIHVFYFNDNQQLRYIRWNPVTNTGYSYYESNLFSGTKFWLSGHSVYNDIDSGYSTGEYLNSSSFLGCTDRYLIVFDSLAFAKAYIKHLMGETVNNYYISTEIVNNDYSTTINKIYDYSSHDTYTTINNNITQAISDKGSGLTDEEYQKIVDDVMKQVQQEIDSKEDSGETGGGSSGGETGGGSSDTWLEKIFNRLGDILEKIGTVTGVDTLITLVQQIADDIATLKEGGTLSADMSDTNGLLKDIKGLLGTLIAVQAVGDIADLLTDTVGDKIGEYVDGVKSAVTEVADALQDVFPFSIPWDLMAIFGLFAAEPVAPEFDFPVKIESLGYEQNIHIDFKNFEGISTLSRAFLSVIFACGLMYLTIRLTNGGDNDD